MIQTKRLLKKLILPFVIIILIALMSSVAYTKLLKSQEESCWKTLESTATTINNEIESRFNDNISILKLVASAMVQENRVESYEAISQHLNAFQSMTIFDRIDIVYSDNRILYQNGTLEELQAETNFQELAEAGEHMSLRTTDSLTGKEIIYYAVPIKKQENTVAILAGIIKCENMPSIFQPNAYKGQAFCTMVDYRDGSFILDAWHDKLGNVYKMKQRTPLKGYEDVDLQDDIKNGRSGVTKYVSAENGINSFMYYTPTETFPWELLIVAQEDVVYENVIALKNTLLQLGAFVGIMILLYFIWTIFTVSQLEKSHEIEQHNLVLKDALAQAKYASEAKTKFLSNMSHDIRTPMNAIVGFTAIAASHIDDKEMVKDSLGKIMTSSNHLLQLINDILDMNRIESGKMQLQIVPCNLASIMHDLVDMVQSQIQAKQLELFVDTMNVKDEAVLTDPMKFNQIFINLIGNAIKFNKVGGFVSVRISQVPSENAGYADYEFVVKDNGNGISPEFIEHIFEPFEREDASRIEKVEGSGLGLAIVKNIVNMMGGSISVSSELNKGSEFTVKLSFKLQEMQNEEINADKLRGMRALVVDDDFNTCDSVSSVLRDLGMEPEWTLTGREAVMKAKQAYEIKNSYAAFIIDWLMPDMNGVEVTRRIRSVIGNETPIFILTAYDWTDIEKEAKEAGVTAFCRKPLFMSDIRHVLLHTVSGSGEEIQDAPQEVYDEAQLKNRRILLADDHQLNRQIIIRLLSDKGMLVDTSENGQIAVDRFDKSEPGTYCAILMDIRMPVMNGLEATKAIRALERPDANTIPIIAMTANAFKEDVDASLDAGMNEHLTKPVEPKHLYEVLAKYLNK